MKQMIQTLIEAPRKEVIGGAIFLTATFALLHVSITIFG